VWGFLVSLFESRGAINLKTFVGLANYKYILTDRSYLRSLVFISEFTLFIVPTTYLSSLLLAALVHNASFLKGLFRTIFFMPQAISYVIAAMIWRMSIFSGLPYGLANIILWILKIEPIVWIGTVDPPWHFVVLITVRLWLQVGFYMIVFVAGMEDIPRELYEAAQVDGAQSKWALFRYITFPLLRNTSIFVVLMNIIHAFQAFAEFYNILGTTWTGGALLSLARPPLVYLYQIAMGDQYYGRGTAGAFVLSALMILVTLIQSRLTGGMGREA
jgi:multiple sugar transport system permease protein